MDKDYGYAGAALGGKASALQNYAVETPQPPASLQSVGKRAEENLERLAEAVRRAESIAEHLRPLNTGSQKADGGGPIGGAVDALDDQQRKTRQRIAELMDALARIEMALGQTS